MLISCIAICGSDLHMYEGRTGAQPGITFGYVQAPCVLK